MSTGLQRIRGAIGMGVTWAAGWAPIGAAVGAVLHVVLPGAPIGMGGVIVLNAATFAVLGLLGGVIFATVLRLAEGHHRFDELSLPRFAIWGALGGLVLGSAAVTVGLWGASFGRLGAGMVCASTFLGASSAAGSLLLARSADAPESLGAGVGVPDVPRSEKEGSYLLRGGG